LRRDLGRQIPQLAAQPLQIRDGIDIEYGGNPGGIHRTSTKAKFGFAESVFRAPIYAEEQAWRTATHSQEIETAVIAWPNDRISRFQTVDCLAQVNDCHERRIRP
jgi:hypothetical protein